MVSDAWTAGNRDKYCIVTMQLPHGDRRQLQQTLFVARCLCVRGIAMCVTGEINGTLTATACRAITRNSTCKTIEYRSDRRLCEDLSS